MTLGDYMREVIENVKSWFGGGKDSEAGEESGRTKRTVNNRKITEEEKQRAYNELEFKDSNKRRERSSSTADSNSKPAR